MKNNVEVPWQIKTITTCNQSTPLLGNYAKELKSGSSRDIFIPMFLEIFTLDVETN